MPFEAGHSIQVSTSCNPNFVLIGSWAYDCDQIKNIGSCDDEVKFLINLGQWNTNGIYETPLQCPQCGCGSEGAVNLNELWAAELYAAEQDLINNFNNTLN